MFLKAGALSLALLLASRLLGLARESAQAAAFGTSGLADVAVLRAQIILQAGTYGSNTITLDADEITVIGELTAPGVLNFRSTAYGM